MRSAALYVWRQAVAASGEQRGGEVRPAAWRRRAGMTVPSADGRSAPRHDALSGPGARGFTWNDSYAPGRWVSASGLLLHVERVPEALRAPPRIERQCPRSGRGGGSGAGVERGAGTGPDLVRAPAAARLFHVEPSGRRLFDGEPSGDEMFHVEPASRRLFDVKRPVDALLHLGTAREDARFHVHQRIHRPHLGLDRPGSGLATLRPGRPRVAGAFDGSGRRRRPGAVTVSRGTGPMARR